MRFSILFGLLLLCQPAVLFANEEIELAAAIGSTGLPSRAPQTTYESPNNRNTQNTTARRSAVARAGLSKSSIAVMVGVVAASIFTASESVSPTISH